MGYVAHNAIVVTTWADGVFNSALAKAASLGMRVAIQDGLSVNRYRSFLVCSDGSKEGWNDSEDGDIARESFVEFLKTFRYEDNSSPVEWVEVRYGSDDRSAHIVRHEWNTK